MTATSFTAPAAAAPSTAPAAALVPVRDHHRATQQAMDAAVRDGVPGVTGQAVDEYGTWQGTSGIGDLTTRQPRGTRDRYRVASVTKTFVATVLLQLEAEDEIRLDDTVERWLPGVVRGHGHDGGRITVRQLLNHTSGIYNWTRDPKIQRTLFSKEFLEHRYDTWTPGQQVRIAMRHEPDFAPGSGWNYSDTNYILAGMIIEKVTGQPYGDEIQQRIIEPLGLRGTTVPGTDPRLPTPSSRAYSTLRDPEEKNTYDVTEYNPSVAGAAGEMISTSADLNRFFTALLGGDLLPKRQMNAMTTTVAMDPEHPDRLRYGLGLRQSKATCGKEIWAHGGDFHGTVAVAATTRDGSHALAFNFNRDRAGDIDAVLDAEFCGT
ncbi:beta-lactamase family protein [Streptomyces spectabilis]|uniref:Beta-lactamase family protein n=2 Tax=Streptomyces spectabilis TaxID=68270 RepID=A0A516RK98_STRST|nr:beta-lactamase family protein [Streptomyces spectabilis]